MTMQKKPKPRPPWNLTRTYKGEVIGANNLHAVASAPLIDYCEGRVMDVLNRSRVKTEKERREKDRGKRSHVAAT